MSEKQKKFQNDIMSKIVTEVSEAIKNGVAPWQKPWKNRNTADCMPTNLATGKSYNGMNSLYLSIISMTSGCNYWLGAKQGIKLGGTPLKGTGVYILAPLLVKDKNNPDKKIVIGFKPTKVHNALTGFTGLEHLIPKAEEVTEDKVIDADMLNDFITSTGADIRHGGDSAYYTPANDYIQLPEKSQFKSVEGYYGTVLHELGHWTGHKGRLDRLNDKSKRGYAFEELIAELSAYYSSIKLDCPNEAENHSSYLASWLESFKSDPKYLWDAAIKAEKASEYLIKLTTKAISKAA